MKNLSYVPLPVLVGRLMNRPFALVTMVVALVAQGGYRFPAHNLGYHIGATNINTSFRRNHDQLWMLIVPFIVIQSANVVTVGGVLPRVRLPRLGHHASQPGGSLAIKCSFYLLGWDSSFSSCCSWSIQ